MPRGRKVQPDRKLETECHYCKKHISRYFSLVREHDNTKGGQKRFFCSPQCYQTFRDREGRIEVIDRQVAILEAEKKALLEELKSKA